MPTEAGPRLHNKRDLKPWKINSSIQTEENKHATILMKINHNYQVASEEFYNAQKFQALESAAQSEVTFPGNVEEEVSIPESGIVKATLADCSCFRPNNYLSSKVTIRQLSAITHCSICEGLINYESLDLNNAEPKINIRKHAEGNVKK